MPGQSCNFDNYIYINGGSHRRPPRRRLLALEVRTIGGLVLPLWAPFLVNKDIRALHNLRFSLSSDRNRQVENIDASILFMPFSIAIPTGSTINNLVATTTG